MVGFFDFKKKQQAAQTTDPGQVGYQQETYTTTTSQPTQQYSSGGQSYNGIGSPPQRQIPQDMNQQPVQTVTRTTVSGNPDNGAVGYQYDQTTNQPNSPYPPEQMNATVPPPPGTQQVAVSQTNGPDGKNTTVGVSNTQQKPGMVNGQASQSAVLNSNINEQKRGELDVMTHLTQRSNRVFMAANNKARELHNMFLDSEHLLHGLLTDGEIYKLFVELKVQPQLIEDALTKIYKKENNPKPPQIAPRIKRIIDNSLIFARKLGFEFISPEHILLSLYEEKEGVGAKILVKLGVKREDLNKRVLGKKEGLEKTKPEDKGKKGLMEQFTIDLTEKAAQGLLDPVVERSVEIERVIHILSRRTKNNPALIGEAGVGKTAVVEGLAEKIVAKQVPESLLDKRILQLDLMGILAGASHRGEFEERMKNMIEDIRNSQGKIIMFIDELHTIVGAGGGGGEGSGDVANFIKPAMARGDLQLIGATTLTEYRKYIEKDPALERRFQPVIIPEPTEEAATKMVKALRNKYEAFHRVKIPDEAIEAAVKYSKRYIGERFLPDKAVDLIDEAASAVRLPLISLPEVMKSLQDRIAQLTQEMTEAEKAKDRVKARILKSKIDDISADLKDKKEEYDIKKAQTTSSVSLEIIKDVVSQWTGIPVNKISGSEMDRLANLEKIMHQRLIGQENAVTVVSQAVKRGRAGLKSASHPIGSFVFLGPTGVGKTELAKTLADVLFDTEESMIRFDMTEYMERHEVAKLLGAPPGYVGYEEGGKLTEAVRRKPYSVVLFDEVEKAHPDIFNILLQILDDGRLTDNKGHTISFKNTVIICTSNIGSKVIQDELLRAGKTEVEEPPVVSTYAFSPHGREILSIGAKFFVRSGQTVAVAPDAEPEKPDVKPILMSTFVFSPRGREILTISGKMYERDAKSTEQAKQNNWNNRSLADYFAGQKIEGTETDATFPNDQIDTQAISSQGQEMITKEHHVIYRTSTTSKVWQSTNLIEYFKDNVVINALPDAPDEQLPTAKLNTHAFSPEDVEVVTFKDRFWRRKAGSTDWETGHTKDYFQGATIEKGEFPINWWNAHAFSPSGKEYVVVGENVWVREQGQTVWKQMSAVEMFGTDSPIPVEEKPAETDTAAAPKPKKSDTWESGMLFDYFDGQKITPSEDQEKAELTPEFPIQGFETQTISPKGVEMITKGNQLMYRDDPTAKEWKSMSLIEYFKGHLVTNATLDAVEEQLPTSKLRTHAFSLDGLEVVTYKDRYWKRKVASTKWETGQLKDYFGDQTVDKGTLPLTHWDIQTFSTKGREIIIVGETLWFKEKGEKTWKQMLLKEYFGADFPLDKELDEKKKIEEETDKKQYGVLKEKVMGELRKFFRPELINRFDEVIIFEPLKFHHMLFIVKLQLKALRKLLEDQDMDFVVTEEAQKEIVRAGFDPVFGARPLRRAIQKLVENPISSLIIEKKAQPGDTILVDYDGDNFLFNVERMEIDPRESAKHVNKSFKCVTCGTEFTTEVLPQATTICTKCASKNVTVVEKEEKKEDDSEDKKKKDTSEKKVDADKDSKKPEDKKNDTLPPPPDEPHDDGAQLQPA